MTIRRREQGFAIGLAAVSLVALAVRLYYQHLLYEFLTLFTDA